MGPDPALKGSTSVAICGHSPPDARRGGAMDYRLALTTLLPPYFAWSPSSCSIRRSWLYFAVRSERASDPVLICPQFVATARSAMVESSVSPERCDITAV